MTIRVALALALAGVSNAALAADEPIYAPAPAWVTSAPFDPAALPADAPAFVLFDQQQMLKDGASWAYTDTAMRATAAESLTQMGTITLPWQPDKGDLIIHRLDILRGDEKIDLLVSGSRFSVIRREQQLEQHQINGVLSATTQVQGLRVGDIVRLTFTISRKDAALGGNAETAMLLPAAPMRIHSARARLIWPDKANVNWRSFGEGVAAKPVRRDGLWEISIPLPLAKQAEMPTDAPPRFHRPPLLEASSFAGWADVSKAAASLYEAEGLIAPGSPLAAEVAKIAAGTNVPRERAAAALRLVQDQVRYLFNGMGDGNYLPQPPSETWRLRYGDCKAKTLLLLALLNQLGIEAEPVLANSQLGDWVPERLPSFGAFDHVLVRATIGGETLWLDGTQAGGRLADLGDTPPFRFVLPARPAGADLLPVPTKPSARPDILAEIEFDQSAGIAFPPTYRAALTLRGAWAATLRHASTQAGEEQIKDFVQSLVSPYVNGGSVIDHKISFDDDAATARVEASGLANLRWSKENERYTLGLDKAVESVSFDVDRARPAWREIPVARPAALHHVMRTRLRLPARPGFTLEGDTSLSETIGGMEVARSSTISDGWLVQEERIAARDAELPASQIAATRERLALAQARLLKIKAPADYPARWQDAMKARAEGRFKPILAAYQGDIDSRSDEAAAYINRARFYDGIYEWKKALADLDKAIELEPSVDNHLWRARILQELGEPKRALADMEAARALDPGSDAAIGMLAALHSEQGETAKAIELVDSRIDAGGADKAGHMAFKAELLADGGRVEEALALIDAAIAAKPRDPELLNNRCWLKGTRNVALESALKDCTKAIELAERPAAMLDSRAMVYFRMGRREEALADLEAAYALDPNIPAIMYLRGIIRGQMGDQASAKADLQAARMMSPRIDWRYGRYGLKADAER